MGVTDLHNIAPVYETQLRVIHGSRAADTFVFHYTLDRPAVRTRYLESIFVAILIPL